MNNFLQRGITALVGATAIIAATVSSPNTFVLVFGIIMLLTLREFYGLAKTSGSKPFSYWGLLFSLSLFALSYAVISGRLESRFLWLLPALLLICFIFPLYGYKDQQPINCLAVTLLGVIYVSVPFSLLLPIAYSRGAYDFSLVMGLLLAQWASDTGAYIAGRSLGKTRLFESVSPSKTWEGTIGGGLLSLSMLYGWAQYFDSLSTLEWLGLSLIIVVFGSLGDLVESLFKRSLAIKNSGNSIPGHGGFLDRFDGLIMALPFATVYLILVLSFEC